MQCDGVTATGHSIVLEPAFQHIQVPLSTLLRESQVRFSVSKQDIPPSFLQCICLVVCPTTPPRVEMRTSMSHTLPARIPGKCFTATASPRSPWSAVLKLCHPPSHVAITSVRAHERLHDCTLPHVDNDDYLKKYTRAPKNQERMN